MKPLAYMLACLLLAASAWAGEARVRAVDAIGITVSDMDRSLDFFSRILGFVPVSDVEVTGDAYEQLRDVFPIRMRVVRLALGREHVELTEYLAPRGRPAPADARSNDRWFQHVAIVVRDMDRAYEWLHDQRVTHVSPEPQRLPDWNPNAGGIRAFYFRDPDGHPLELIWFPPGKGDPRWQEPTERLFLGIDHTAIAVGDPGLLSRRPRLPGRRRQRELRPRAGAPERRPWRTTSHHESPRRRRARHRVPRIPDPAQWTSVPCRRARERSRPLAHTPRRPRRCRAGRSRTGPRGGDPRARARLRPRSHRA